jgi:hypothetical protein
MEISNVTFKGTPEEFRSVAHLFSKPGIGVVPITESVGTNKSLEPLNGAANEDVILRVLKRRRIRKGQIALYKAFSNAGEDWMSSSAVAAKMKIRRPQLSGVLGALGRRINETEGVDQSNPPGIALFLEYKQDNGGEYYYRLRQPVRAILMREGMM